MAIGAMTILVAPVLGSTSASVAATPSVAVPQPPPVAGLPANLGLASQTVPKGLPPIKHVFVIMLENESESATFASDPYLKTLETQGAYVPNYYGTGHLSNDNYVAMISGQAPNPQNQADCQYYDDFVGLPPVVAGTGTPLDGQAVGAGCVYPSSVQTISNQLTAKGLAWKGYMEDMGNVPSRESAVCGHPALNTQDGTQSAVAGDGYVSRHDPFVYFHNIIDASECDKVVPLGTATGSLPSSAPPGTTGLVTNLKSESTTPNLSFIVPNVCDDGHDYPCTNEPTPTSATCATIHETAGAVCDIDLWLRVWVPIITHSPAYKDGGLLLVTFDEANFPGDVQASDYSAVPADTSSCCNEMPGPDSPLPGIAGMGGGKVGLVALSRFIKPGTVSAVSYNHYALLGSIEDLFGLSRLGFAADVPNTFGSDIYTNP